MSEEDPRQLRTERDLYRRLLELGGASLGDGFVADALAMLVEVSGASHGYLELRDLEATPVQWTSTGLSREEVNGAKAAVSQGIIAKAIARGELLQTASARVDPRFSALDSVKDAEIEAVLCSPIGAAPPLGAIYLERRVGGSFSEEDCARVQLVCRHLTPFVRQRVEELEREEADPTRELRESLHADELVGRSPALLGVLREALMVAPLDVTLLLTGESGTGKSQLAHIIHQNGPRAGKPFVELNCAAIPAELLENELFGAHRGGHSTAQAAVPGKIMHADGGTLFLDEIGEMPLPSQPKLLQFLQSREYYPLGSASPERADVRIMAATNQDLEARVAQGLFREDLFYRLQVLPIRMPSLDERREDIAEIASYLCESLCQKHALPIKTLSARARQALQVAEWPGNVRQLANCLEAAVIRAASEQMAQVEPRHLFPGQDHPDIEAESLQSATREFQRAFVSATLDDCGWNVSETARRLDVARSHLYNLIQAFGLERQ